MRNCMILLPFICFAACAFAAAETTKLYLKIFGTREAFDAVIDAVYKKGDPKNSGNVPIATFASNIYGFFPQKGLPAGFDKKLNAEFSTQDTNKDGVLTKAEFKNAIYAMFDRNVVVDKDLCNKVETAMKPCSRGFHSFRDVSKTFDRDDRKAIVGACKNGLSSTQGFTTEHCVTAVVDGPGYKKKSKVSCAAIKECVNMHFQRDENEAFKNDMNYLHKAGKPYTITMWAGLLATISLALASLAFPPLIIPALVAAAVNWVGFTGSIAWDIRQYAAIRRFKKQAEKEAKELTTSKK